MTVEEYRVFGPPGTGKTTFLGKQVRSWVEEYGPDDVIVSSFTRSAAAEIASRDLPITRRQVGTLHSFAFRSVGTATEIAEPHVREFNDAHPAYRLTLDERGQIDVDEPVAERASTTEGDRLLGALEVLRARIVPPEAWPASVRGFARAWNGWKADTGRLDFTDLIETALHDTTSAPGAPAAACFDEVQDFTPLELALVRHWSEAMERVLLAGDDDQCIYGFKGATPDAFLDPPVDETRKRVLGQSWRVPAAVHAVSSAWVERLTRREPKTYAPRADADGTVRFLRGASFRYPEEIVADAVDTIDGGRSAMILTTCSYMLDPIKTLLRRDGVPFHNPYRRKRGDWNPLVQGTEARRSASDRLLAYLRTQPAAWGDESRWYSGDDVKAWLYPLATKGLLARGAKTRVETLGGADPIDLDEFDALWLEDRLVEVVDATMRGDLDWYAANLLATKRKPFEFPLHVASRRGPADLRERPRLVIGTIHSVKGGEADVVYLLPDLSAPGIRQWDGGPLERDEVIRQFYVGMTRARDELVVCDRSSPAAVRPDSLVNGAW